MIAVITGWPNDAQLFSVSAKICSTLYVLGLVCIYVKFKNRVQFLTS